MAIIRDGNSAMKVNARNASPVNEIRAGFLRALVALCEAILSHTETRRARSVSLMGTLRILSSVAMGLGLAITHLPFAESAICARQRSTPDTCAGECN